MAVYPTGVKVFTPKTNLVDTVYAGDVNDLQDEVAAIETALGTIPERATSLPISDTKTKDYGTVAGRLQSMQMGDDVPVAHIAASSVPIKVGVETYISFKKVRDPFGLFNGSDFTIPVSSWCVVTSNAYWSHDANGYRMLFLMDGNNNEYTADQKPALSWWDRGTRNILVWQGYVKAGTRLRSKVYQNSDEGRTVGVDFSVSLTRRYADNLY